MMPYELNQFVKSIATTVKVVQEEDLMKTVAEEIKMEDPAEAETIIEEAVSGAKKTRVHKKNIEESSGEV
jgi:hypothetical protein